MGIGEVGSEAFIIGDSMRLGSWVLIEFLDHALVLGGKRKRPVTCRAIGKVVENDGPSLTLAHWVVVGQDEETRDLNREEVVVVKKCVKRWANLSRFRWKK